MGDDINSGFEMVCANWMMSITARFTPSQMCEIRELGYDGCCMTERHASLITTLLLSCSLFFHSSFPHVTCTAHYPIAILNYLRLSYTRSWLISTWWCWVWVWFCLKGCLVAWHYTGQIIKISIICNQLKTLGLACTIKPVSDD